MDTSRDRERERDQNKRRQKEEWEILLETKSEGKVRIGEVNRFLCSSSALSYVWHYRNNIQQQYLNNIKNSQRARHSYMTDRIYLNYIANFIPLLNLGLLCFDQTETTFVDFKTKYWDALIEMLLFHWLLFRFVMKTNKLQPPPSHSLYKQFSKRSVSVWVWTRALWLKNTLCCRRGVQSNM